MSEKNYKVLGVVPYQLCPKCNGDGKMMEQVSATNPGIALKRCNVCNGEKIIPMHIIETINMGVDFSLKGSDLEIMLERYNYKDKRI